MQKENIKKLEKVEPENISIKLNSQEDIYGLHLKYISENLTGLQKYYNNHLNSKEKISKEKINLYFIKINSTISLLSEEREKMQSKYESILKLNEQKIRILYSDIFNLKIKNTFLENNIEVLLKKEKEYRLVKEKTGVVVENGVIVYNNRKENEIFILRKENSTLKNVINENEKKIDEIKEKLKNDKENHDKQVSNLNHKINQLKYRLRQSNPKIKVQSCSSTNINTNDTSNPNMKLNFTVNNSINKVNSKVLTNGVNNSNNEMSFNNNKNSNNCIKRKYDSILLNKKKKKREKILINSEVKSISFANNRSSSGQLKIRNKVVKKIKTKNKEISPTTFHKDLNLSNLNVSPIQSKKILCLTPQNNGDNNPVLSFQKITDIKKRVKLKVINKNGKIMNNCLSRHNINSSNNLKVLYKNKSKNTIIKNNGNINNMPKIIKKELTWSNNLILNNNSVIPTSNFKITKSRKINGKIKGIKEINKTSIIKSPQNLGNNKRKRNMISNVVGKNYSITNKTSLSSIRKKNTINTSINSFNKNMLNSPSGNNM